MESQENTEPMFKKYIETLKTFIEEKPNVDQDEVKPTPAELEAEPTNAQESIQEPMKEDNVQNVDFSNVELGLQQLAAKFDEFSYVMSMNRQLHEELQTYKSGLKRDMQMPLLKHLMQWHGKINDLYQFYDKKQHEPEVDYKELFSKLLKEYKFLAAGVEDTLFDYDIEPVCPQAGEAFNPRVQKAIRTVETSEPEKDKTIVECANIGFMDTTSNKSLKQPEVAVYRVTNAEEQTQI